MVILEDEDGTVKKVLFPQENPEDERHEYAPITPADVALAVRQAFFDDKVKLPTFEQRLERMQHTQPVVLHLEIISCDIVRPRGGTDKVVLELAPQQAKMLLWASVGEKRAQEVFDSRLHCQFDITRGCGEDLARALGIKNVKVIEAG